MKFTSKVNSSLFILFFVYGCSTIDCVLQYVGPPVAYVMQFVVKTTVSPWKYKKMISTDAFRGPLSKVFEIIQHINNFQLRNG